MMPHEDNPLAVVSKKVDFKDGFSLLGGQHEISESFL